MSISLYGILCLALIMIYNMVSVHSQETPTYSNATAEYYIYTASESTPPSRTIVCSNSDLCFIKCSGELSCASSTISASGTSNLILRCLSRYACRTLTISDGPTASADIECVSQFGSACGGTNINSYYSTFELRNTPNINILCDQVDTSDSSDGGSCYGLTVRATNADQVSIDCMDSQDCYNSNIYVEEVSTSVSIAGYGEEALYSIYIDASSATKLSVGCKAKEACAYAEIYPPYESEYAFDIFCLYIYQSCYTVRVHLPTSEFTDNFMEMICPATSRGSYTCDFDFYCNDLSTTNPMTSTSYSSPRWVCNDDDCCPWTDYDNIVQSSTVAEPLSNAMSPTSSNDTAEWYEITASSLYEMISCTKQACFIECSVADACRYAAVYAGASEYLRVTCSGTSGCEFMYIYEGPAAQADILCTAKLGTGCGQAVFLLGDTPVVNIECAEGPTSSSSGNCYYMVLNAENTVNLTVNCTGDYACSDGVFRLYHTQNIVLNANYYGLDDAFVSAQGASYLEINCNSQYSCQYLDVYPPYTEEYAFNMYCAPHSYSCYAVDVKVPDSTSFTTNYMSLLCPRTNTRSYTCDIDFWCLDISSTASVTSMTTTTTANRYYCDDTDCCPWSDSGSSSPYTFKPGTTYSVLPNSMEATSTDSSGDHYVISASSTDLREISCTNPAGCYIQCTDSDACEYFVIYAGGTDYLQLVCDGLRSCERVYITKGPAVGADINCTAALGLACQYSTFIFDDDSDLVLNLFCDSDTTGSSSGGCDTLQVLAPYAAEANIYCSGAYSCEDARFDIGEATVATVIANAYRALDSAWIFATNAGRLNMECNGSYSCYYCDVYAPYHSEYVYRLTCGEANAACDYLDIVAGDSSVNENNYISLECLTEIVLPASSYSAVDINCEMRFYCGTLSSYSYTELSYDKTSEHIVCYDDDCCPWSDENYMTAPKECIFENGEFCGSSLFVRGFNIWTLELSGNAILDSDYLVQNTESWTDEGASCSLSSLEFSSSYSSYSDYAAADATNIAGEYNSGVNAAGGSLSSARSNSKTYAGKEQSYIYSMDVSCATASASLVASNSIYWNANFVNELRSLPTVYLDSYLDDYIDFWNAYGTHIQKTASLGGRVRGSVVSSKCNVMQSYGDAQSYEVCLNGAYKGVEAQGCGGESESSQSNNTAALLVTKTLIDVKGGDAAAFSTIFQEFQSKSNDFQSWINDLAVTPDVIGGNLGAIHDVILNAIALGSHRLNDDLSAANQKSDSDWTNIANALKSAFEERSDQLVAQETFDSEECEITTCKGGTVDEETCSCSGCGDNGCCSLVQDDAAPGAVYCLWCTAFIISTAAFLFH